MPGDEQQRAHLHELGFTQRVAMLLQRDQRADQIRPWPPTPLGDDVPQIRVQGIPRHHHALPQFRRHKRIKAGCHHRRPFQKLDVVRVGYAQQLGDYDHWQGIGEVSNEINCRASFGHILEQVANRGADARLQLINHARCKCRRDQRSQAGVIWGVGAQHRFADSTALGLHRLVTRTRSRRETGVSQAVDDVDEASNCPRPELLVPLHRCVGEQMAIQRVWILAELDLPPNEWTLDQAALFDHPQAVKTIVKETGWDEIKAVVHCQGSTSFTMSALAGLVPEVTTIVSNAVSVYVDLPRVSVIKLAYLLPIASRFTRYLNPQWGLYAPAWFPRLIATTVAAVHHECSNPVCKQVSFTYGSGMPALWSHANLSAATHEWLKQEFAHVPLSFFRQIARCARRGHLVSVEGHAELPLDFTAAPPKTRARFALFAGADSRCFFPSSQVKTFRWLDRQQPGLHSLHLIDGYGHLDVFLGSNAVRETFPLILAELDAPTRVGAGSARRR